MCSPTYDAILVVSAYIVLLRGLYFVIIIIIVFFFGEKLNSPDSCKTQCQTYTSKYLRSYTYAARKPGGVKKKSVPTIIRGRAVPNYTLESLNDCYIEKLTRVPATIL